jgi:hypothetical protein
MPETPIASGTSEQFPISESSRPSWLSTSAASTSRSLGFKPCAFILSPREVPGGVRSIRDCQDRFHAASRISSSDANGAVLLGVAAGGASSSGHRVFGLNPRKAAHAVQS